MDAKVVFGEEIDFTELGGGVSRKVLAYSDELMVVEVHFQKGAVGSIHTHPHVQCTYVKEGKFRYTANGKDTEIASGDSVAVPSDLPHGLLCLEEGTVLDIFTPARKDFL